MRLALTGILIGCSSAPTLSVSPTTLPRGAVDSTVAARITSQVDSALSARQIPGASVAILRYDTLVFAQGFGFANLETHAPVTSETVFQIASLTKVFTATAIMMLVEDGKVELDVPAARYLSWLPSKYSAITVRQLLTHTSGVNPDLRNANIDEMDIDEFKRRLNDRPESFPPGTKAQYANTGFVLLSSIVEASSGQTFGDFLRRRIFGPLGMRQTGYRVPEQTDARHAKGYELVNRQLKEAPHVFSGWGNSGIETTANDMAIFASALERRVLLRPATYDLMYTPGRLANDSIARFTSSGVPTSFGFAWFIQTFRGVPLLQHGGAVAGFSSQLNRFIGAGWTILVLSNGKQGADRRGQADALAGVIANAIGIGLPTPQR